VRGGGWVHSLRLTLHSRMSSNLDGQRTAIMLYFSMKCIAISPIAPPESSTCWDKAREEQCGIRRERSTSTQRADRAHSTRVGWARIFVYS
jgi:hypothetical protein